MIDELDKYIKKAHDALADNKYVEVEKYFQKALEEIHNIEDEIKNPIFSLQDGLVDRVTIAMSQYRAHVHTNLGIAKKILNKDESATEHYRLAILNSKKCNELKTASIAANNLGALYYDYGELDKARHYFEIALELSASIGNESSIGCILNNLGSIYRRLNQPEKAIKYNEKAVEIGRNYDDRRELAKRIRNLATSNYEAGNIEDATRLLEEALSIANEIGDQSEISSAHYELCLIYINFATPEKAIQEGLLALESEKQIGNQLRTAEVYHLLGISYTRNNNLLLGRHYTEEAIKNAIATKDRLLEGQSRLTLSKILHSIGQEQSAIDEAEISIKVMSESGDSMSLFKAISHLTILLSSKGEVQKLEKFITEQIEAVEGFGDIHQAIHLKTNLAAITNDSALAIKLCNEILETQSKYVSPFTRCLALLNLGRIERDNKSNKDCLSIFQNALSLAIEYNYVDLQAIAFLDIATVYFKRENLNNTLSCLTRAYELTVNTESDTRAKIITKKAIVHYLLNELDKAEPLFDIFIEYFEKLRNDFTKSSWKEQLQQQHQNFFLLAIINSIELGKKSNNFNFYKKAYERTVRIKSRLLIDIMTSENIVFPNEKTQEILKQIDSEHSTIFDNGRASSIDLFRKEDFHSVSGYERIEENRINNAKAKIKKLETQLRHHDPTALSLVSANVLCLREIFNHLDDKTQVIELVKLNDKFVVFIIDKNGLVFEPYEASEKTIVDLMIEFYRLIKSFQNGIIDNEAATKRIETIIAEIGNNTLPAHFWQFFGGKQLILIPDAELFGFPFHAVCQQDSGKLLGEMYSDGIIYAPNIQAWILCKEKHETMSIGKKAVFFGNPNFDIPCLKLEYAEIEVIETSKYFENPKIYLRDSATIDTFINAVKDAGFVYFAGHASFSKTDPMDSKIFLNDGSISARDFLSYRIDLRNCDTIILSACEMGRAALSNGMEISGFLRSIFHSGVRSIIASSWTVGDEVANKLMQNFCHLWKGQGWHKGPALQKAISDLRNTDISKANPVGWAPFTIWGS